VSLHSADVAFGEGLGGRGRRRRRVCRRGCVAEQDQLTDVVAATIDKSSTTTRLRCSPPTPLPSPMYQRPRSRGFSSISSLLQARDLGLTGLLSGLSVGSCHRPGPFVIGVLTPTATRAHPRRPSQSRNVQTDKSRTSLMRNGQIFENPTNAVTHRRAPLAAIHGSGPTTRSGVSLTS
jgi:hypothetical protein